MASLMKRLSQRVAGSGTEKGSNRESVAHKEFARMGEDAMAYFNAVSRQPFADQAVAFLNAYWEEVGDQAPFIFEVAYPTIRYADMHVNGIQYIHLYSEGNELEFTAGLYFYEKLCQKVFDTPAGAPWRSDEQWAPSMPEMLTAIVRKQELRDKVDVNFDGKISFLEYLLYQYRDLASPAEFVARGMENSTESPMVKAARMALMDVNKRIREFEAEKARLKEASKLPGVKGLGAKHQLTGLLKSPVAEKLQVALIKAEAAVRTAAKQAKAEMAEGGASGPNAGALWWMNRDLEEKKKLYGHAKK